MVEVGDLSSYREWQSKLETGKIPDANVKLEDLLDKSKGYSFVDNTGAILKTFSYYKRASKPNQISQSDSHENQMPLEYSGKNMIIRWKGSGKTTFGKMWLEFFKGNKELFKDTEIYDSDLFPIPGQFVCVFIDFTDINPDNIFSYLVKQFNGALKEAGIDKSIEYSGRTDYCGRAFDLMERILRGVDKECVLFVDNYDQMMNRTETDPTFTPHEVFSVIDTFFHRFKENPKFSIALTMGTHRKLVNMDFRDFDRNECLTYEYEWDTVFGYKWENVEELYSPQLSMLEKVYNVSRDKLKMSIILMYGGYSFSPANKLIFNFETLNNFLRTGAFKFNMTIPDIVKSTEDRVLHVHGYGRSERDDCKSMLMKVLYKLLSSCSLTYDLGICDMSWAYDDLITDHGHGAICMRLFNEGLLTFHNDNKPRSWGNWYTLKIPNISAHKALIEIFFPYIEKISPEKINELIESLNFAEIVNMLQEPIYKIQVELGNRFEPTRDYSNKSFMGIFYILLNAFHFKLQYAAFLSPFSDRRKVRPCWTQVDEEGHRSSSNRSIYIHSTDIVNSFMFSNIHTADVELVRREMIEHLDELKTIPGGTESKKKIYNAQYPNHMFIIILSTKGQFAALLGPLRCDEVKNILEEIKILPDPQFIIKCNMIIE